MDGYIVGSMISANSIVGEQIQANSIKATNLEIDVQKKIESATDEETVKTLIKADLDGFEVNVSNTYETKADSTSKFDDVNNSISTLTGRISSAESKITDNAITNVVKQNFYTKEETNNQITSKGYQTASQVQQTVDQLQIKFTESGGYNLFLNSKFNNGHGAYWWNQQYNNPQGSCNFLNHTSDWGFPDSGVNTIEYILPVGKSNVEWGVSQQVKVAIGKKYTVSFYYASHRCTSANLIIRQPDGYWLTNHAWNPSEYSGGRGSANNWGYKTFTFTAKHEIYQIQIVMNNCSDSSIPGYFWIAKPMCEEGSIASAWSPAPNEVSDGITTINKDGIEVDCSNVNTKAQMKADGFKIIRKSDNKELFNASNGNLTMEGTLATGTSGKHIKVSDSNYKVYDGTTQKAFFGLASNDVWTDVPKLFMGIRGWGESCGYDYFSINTYDANNNPQSYPTAYLDLAYYNINKQDWSNIKMYGDGNITISPINNLIITSNTNNGSYGGTGENKIAEFGTSVSSYYNGYLDIGAITNCDKNANGLVLEHNRNGVWCAVRVNVDSNHDKYFRPMENNADMRCGSSGFKWHSVWASNGSVQTSDERHKMKMGVLDNEECYQMVKNTDIYKYCMLPKSKDDMSEDEIKKMAKKASKEEIAIQTGIMAQDILGYDCAKYVLTHDSWLDEENNEEKEMYNINPYGFSAVIMAALKEEIDKREALEKRMETLEEKLNQLISLQK